MIDKIKIYFIVTQIIFDMATPALIGVYIAYKLNKSNLEMGLYAACGILIGFLVAFINLFVLYKKYLKDDKSKKV